MVSAAHVYKTSSLRRIASDYLSDTDDGLCNSVAIYLCVTTVLILLPSALAMLRNSGRSSRRRIERLPHTTLSVAPPQDDEVYKQKSEM